MNKTGIITKSQKELYYVKSENMTFKAKARGVFRERNVKPLVGDRVDIQILDDGTAYIENVHPRINSLVRPPIANIDQIILISSLVEPKLNYTIFDKYLVMLEHYGIDVKIVINKIELASKEEIEEFEKIYSLTDYNYIFTSAVEKTGIEKLKTLMTDKISSFAGPSGVGKSTLLNLISTDINAETGDISKKTARGKHTTRHVELFELYEDTFIFDTPGFSSLTLDFIDEFRDVKDYFEEFNKFKSGCKFSNCLHLNEPNCGVKKALEEKQISNSRYENYKYIIDEIINNRRY